MMNLSSSRIFYYADELILLRDMTPLCALGSPLATDDRDSVLKGEGGGVINP